MTPFRRGALRLIALALFLISLPVAFAQQTLGGLTGTVTDSSGAVVPGATIQLTGDENGVSLTTTSKANGTYQFQNLPVGNYTLTFTHDGFDTEKVPAISVKESRTGTINAALKAGSTATTVNVNEQPLMNETDATNGYVLDSQQVQETPLATGSFTRLATLTPGVSGELLAGIGTNAGLGNQPIWANGQRDTSNGFTVNGVDVTNLFNGKSSSQSQSQRYNFNIGQGAAVAGQNETNTSVYGSNGNSLATPPPDFIQEVRVNTSEYDASQGNHSGAQIDVNTATGSNRYHGNAYAIRATNAFNAAPYFNKQAVLQLGTLPYAYLVPQLHRDVIGGTAGGPIKKDKLFVFLGYQYEHDTDALKGYSTLTVPYFNPANPGLASGIFYPGTNGTAQGSCPTEPTSAIGLTDDRSTQGILNAMTAWNAETCAYTANNSKTTAGSLTQAITTVDPVAMAILQAKLPNGQYLIPSVQNTSISSDASTNVFLNQPSLFRNYNATAAMDYNVNSRDRFSAKYFYQHDPDASPFTYASTEGFPAIQDNGAQVAGLVNTITFGSRINWEQRIGLSRQKSYSYFQNQTGQGNLGVQFPGGTTLPGLSLGKFGYSSGGSVTVGPNSNFANAGYFQNRLNPESNVVFTAGKHNLSAGSSYNFTQLNIRNRRSGLGTLSTANFNTFAEGQVSSSTLLTGNANRYYRANDFGAFLQDQFRPLSNLSLTAGVRFDYDGGFTEKYGNLFNFSPTLYAQNGVGFTVAGNNPFVSSSSGSVVGTTNSTLTGRQWGISPRLGFAFTPKQNHGKVVFRGSFGTFYDRGEYFSYLSQPAGSSTGGPFGATQAPPLANYITGTGTLTLENPIGSATVPAASSDPSTFAAKIPTLAGIKTACAGLVAEQAGGDCPLQPYNFGAYAAGNKLPYIIDFSFGVQTQLTSSLAFAVGYVGNRGRHSVIPVPFNEPGIATPTNPINGETSSYGYEVLNAASPSVINGHTYYNPISTEPYNTYDGGNIDLRVPYVGYSPNAALFKAAGVSAFDSLQVSVTKRMDKLLSFQLSYTFSHALDEQSDLGLFFTGDNPNHLRDSWASADFDRTQVLVFNYLIRVPNLVHSHNLLSKFTNGWQLVGITTVQSGEPYSLYEYDGAVGSIYFGNFPTLANPVLGIKNGKNPNSAKTGASGSQLLPNGKGGYYYQNEIDETQLNVNLLQPGQKGIPNCTSLSEPCDYFENDFTPGQRNIFRQSLQKDADVSFQKVTNLTERVAARYTFDVFNITNSSSFDVPNNSASISASRFKGVQSVAPYNYGYGQVVSSQATNLADTGILAPQPGTGTYSGLYNIPANNSTSTFGAVRNTIGLNRSIEMSLHLLF
jgi:hypothetical protein